MQKKDYEKCKEINLNRKEEIYLNDLPCGRTLFKVKYGRDYIYYIEVEKTECTCCVQRFNFFKNVPESKYGKNFIEVIFRKIYEDGKGSFAGLCLNKKFILHFDEIVLLDRLKEKYSIEDKYLFC